MLLRMLFIITLVQVTPNCFSESLADKLKNKIESLKNKDGSSAGVIPKEAEKLSVLNDGNSVETPRQESAATDGKTDCRKPKNQFEKDNCCKSFGRDLDYCIEKLSNPRKSKDQKLSWEGNAYTTEMAFSDFKNSKNSSTDLKGIHIGMPQVEVMNKLSLTFTRIEEPKKWKSSQLYSVYIWEDPENLRNLKLNRTAAQRKAAKRESYSLAGVRVLAITMFFIDQRLALFSLQFRTENSGDNSGFQTVGLPILKQKFPSSYSFERANDLTAYKNNAPFFMESESIKRLFSKFLRSRKIIPENLSDEEIGVFIKDFYKTHIGFLRLTPDGMPTDNWNEPWPYILNVEECANGVNLFGDKSDDETMGLFCVPGRGDSPTVQLNITTETSKLALWAVRRTLTDEIGAAVKKGTEESVKKQKKDL
jgi:hypothetical protein